MVCFIKIHLKYKARINYKLRWVDCANHRYESACYKGGGGGGICVYMCKSYRWDVTAKN